MAANNTIISINTKITIKMFARNNRIIIKESFAGTARTSNHSTKFAILVMSAISVLLYQPLHFVSNNNILVVR